MNVNIDFVLFYLIFHLLALIISMIGSLFLTKVLKLNKTGIRITGLVYIFIIVSVNLIFYRYDIYGVF